MHSSMTHHSCVERCAAQNSVTPNKEQLGYTKAWKTLQSWSGNSSAAVFWKITKSQWKQCGCFVHLQCLCVCVLGVVCYHIINPNIAMHQPPLSILHESFLHNLSFHPSICSPSIHQAVWVDLWHYDIAWWSLRSIFCGGLHLPLFLSFHHYFSSSLCQRCDWICHVPTKTDGVRWSDWCTLPHYLFMTISWSLLDRYDLFKWWLWLKVSLWLSTFIFQYHSPFIFSGSDLYRPCSPQSDCLVLISQQHASVGWRRRFIPTQVHLAQSHLWEKV